jgi:hypothetical protein
LSESGLSSGLSSSGLSDLDQIKPALIADDEFVSGIVDNIMTNSNLSEIIEQIDAVQTENRELRELLYAQQKAINEMNIMLLKVFSQSMHQTAPAPVPKHVPEPVPAVHVPVCEEHVPAPAHEPEQEEQKEQKEQETEEDEAEEAESIHLDVVETSNSNMQIVD